MMTFFHDILLYFLFYQTYNQAFITLKLKFFYLIKIIQFKSQFIFLVNNVKFKNYSYK